MKNQETTIKTYRCPQCRKIYSESEAGGLGYKCPDCKRYV